MSVSNLSLGMSKERLLALASQHGTPLYVYNGDLIVERYNEFHSFFPWKHLKVFYAMKANWNIAILQLLLQQGCGIDAVSEAEVLLARRIGFSPESILYTANHITDDEMIRVQREGVLFNIGSLSLLERFGKMFAGSDVCLRFNPDVVAGFHVHVRTAGGKTKFGIPLTDVDRVLALVDEYGLKVVGVHEHTGVGIREMADQFQAIENILNVVTSERFPHLRFVDLGSGFCIPYSPDDERINYHQFGGKVVSRFSAFCQTFGRELQLCFEPGRYLVAEAGVLLVNVTTLKENDGRHIVGVDSGMNHLIRPMMYGAYHHIVNLSSEGNQVMYDVCGNICESGDRFAEDRMLSCVGEGNVLAIECVGAYGYSMGSLYNLRSMPAEVFVQGDVAELVTQRLTSTELVQHVLADGSTRRRS